MNSISLKLLFLVIVSATIIVGDDIHLHEHHQHNHQEEEQEILEKLTKPANVNIRPVGVNGTGPTVVTVDMYIRNIQKIDQLEGTWKLQMTYRQQWNDNRLAYTEQAGDLKYLTLTSTKSIWTPDIFFPNEINSELHSLMKPNILVRIYPNGNVLFSTRITLTLLCKDALVAPKKSKVVCSIIQESYSYTTDDIILRWKETEPIQIVSDKVLVPNFKLQGVETKYAEETLATGSYGNIKADFTFGRSECIA